MRRADRLFQIVLCLRRRRAVTADQMAAESEVSPRTIYRDIRDLMVNGVPIDGFAVGAQIVRGWADPELARAARTAFERIEAVLPERLRTMPEPEPFYVPDLFTREETKKFLGDPRRAIYAKHQIRIDYTRADGEASERQVEPVGLFFWGNRWTLGAWCNLRRAYRSFRLDRIEGLVVLPEFELTHDVDKYMEAMNQEE